MNTQSRLANFFFSQFMGWMVVLVVGCYFIFAFDKKALSQPQAEAGALGTVKHYYGALKLAYIKKGYRP
jgi:hypothetical protein